MTASLLFVDDDPQIVRAIVPALQVSGMHVTVATNGTDAIYHVDKHRWDAVVVDLGLPDMDGKVVVQHLRLKFRTPVVVISAQHSTNVVSAARDAGADSFLHKPFRTPDLVNCVHEAITKASGKR